MKMVVLGVVVAIVLAGVVSLVLGTRQRTAYESFDRERPRRRAGTQPGRLRLVGQSRRQGKAVMRPAGSHLGRGGGRNSTGRGCGPGVDHIGLRGPSARQVSMTMQMQAPGLHAQTGDSREILNAWRPSNLQVSTDNSAHALA